MSDPGGALASGPESRVVVDALGSILDGDGPGGRQLLFDGAATTGWAAVRHRLDVAGRALALDAELSPDDAMRWCEQVAVLAARARVVPVPDGIVDVLAAWSSGLGVPVPVDLIDGSIDLVPEDERAFVACLVLAWLVDRSGFPPQVVA